MGTAGFDDPIPARLGAFIRVRDELTASGDLGATIRAALVAPAADGQPMEPLAADARSVADGRERAFLKLVAGQLRAQLALTRNDIATVDEAITTALALIEPAWQSVQNERLRQWRSWALLLQAELAHARNYATGAAEILVKARQLRTDGNEPIPFLRLDPFVRVPVASGHQVEATTHRRRLEHRHLH